MAGAPGGSSPFRTLNTVTVCSVEDLYESHVAVPCCRKIVCFVSASQSNTGNR